RPPPVGIGLVELIHYRAARIPIRDQRDFARSQRFPCRRRAHLLHVQQFLLLQCRRDILSRRRNLHHFRRPIAKGQSQPCRQNDRENEHPEQRLRLTREFPEPHQREL